MCLEDPCSVANCGHRAKCVLSENKKGHSDGKNATSSDVVGEVKPESAQRIIAK